MEPTGERFIPGHGGAQIAYEHLLRYLFAREAVRGKRVLDLGSGEGYGAFLLAQRAAEVVGVDASDDAVRHAAAKYSLPNLSFVPGSALAIPVAGTFDVVTCFEVLEHVEDPEALIVESTRVLQPGGLFLVSTPNKKAYTDDTQITNPFHVKEFYFDEFRALLARHFAYHTFFGQRIIFGAALWNLSSRADRRPPARGGRPPRPDGRRIGEYAIRLDADGAVPFSDSEPSADEPWYFVAACSAEPIPDRLNARSVYLNDHSRLMQSDFVAATRRWQQELDALRQDGERLRGTVATVEAKRDKQAALLQAHEDTQAAAETAMRSLEAAHALAGVRNDALEADRTALHARVAALEAAISRTEARADAERAYLESTLAEARARAEGAAIELHSRETQWGAQTRQFSERLTSTSTALQAIESSVAWKVIVRYRTLLDRLAPVGTGQREIYARALAGVRRIYRAAGAARARARAGPLSFKTLLAASTAASAPAVVPLPSAPAADGTGPGPAVDIIIPVYDGVAALGGCLDSVLRHTDLSRHHLVIIDDASPDPQVGAALTAFRARHREHGRVEVATHPQNQGFVRTVNEGFRHSDRDVVLLNADTIVTAGWLDKLGRAAYSDSNVATVTPFSNNATICSIPEFAKDNALPAGFTVDGFAALIDRIALRYYPRIPTGVGFCMYIRRAALEAVGEFDEERFGRGYGEENDFCMRAARAGWVHVLDDATYIYHHGAASFGDDVKRAQIERHLKILDQLYPEYLPAVQRFIAQNPLRPLHEHITAWMARPDALAH